MTLTSKFNQYDGMYDKNDVSKAANKVKHETTVLEN